MSAPTAYRIVIRDGKTIIGRTEGVPSIADVRRELARMQRVYPDSTLEAFLHDGDLGVWRDVSDEDIDRLLAVNAAMALASLQQEGLPLIRWTVTDFDPDVLTGYTDDRDVLATYAEQLGFDMQNSETASHTRITASGTYRGAQVTITSTVFHAVPMGQVAEVSS